MYSLEELKIVALRIDCCAYMKSKLQFADLIYEDENVNLTQSKTEKLRDIDIVIELDDLEIKMNKLNILSKEFSEKE